MVLFKEAGIIAFCYCLSQRKQFHTEKPPLGCVTLFQESFYPAEISSDTPGSNVQKVQKIQYFRLGLE